MKPPRPRVIGLTGSIGMGKSTVAAMARRLGVPVDDADATVRRAMAPEGAAFAAIAESFPAVMRDGLIDRRTLGQLVFNDSAALARLEAILHPLVARERVAFLAQARRRGSRLAILDIPLLFERDLASAAETVLVVSAPSFVQRARVLRRPGMTPARFGAVLALQMPDRDKRRLADFVLPTGLGRADTCKRLRRILKAIDSGKAPLNKPHSNRHIGKLHARNRPRYRNHRP